MKKTILLLAALLPLGACKNMCGGSDCCDKGECNAEQAACCADGTCEGCQMKAKAKETAESMVMTNLELQKTP
ncbi:MAG: hypothetical protein R3F33_05500 [Planctomycetota bacterium]